ncbi:basic proline-rich protein-like [Mustela lutreola]|uniref:basic proline-rich protein-like n=1 Tax=Mustela lutreola TaxID=9666 RepID=UPI0027978B6B|nr:basic proline-rich protein-like [Mustela lutreola]
MALCPPPSRVLLSLGVCSFSFSLDAQPRDCASFLLPVLQGPGAGGPDTPQGERARPLLHPLRVPSALAATPASSRPRGRRPREAAWSAAAPPAGRRSRTPNAPSRRRSLDVPLLSLNVSALPTPARCRDPTESPRSPRQIRTCPAPPLQSPPLVQLGHGAGASAVAAGNKAARPCPTKESAGGQTASRRGPGVGSASEPPSAGVPGRRTPRRRGAGAGPGAALQARGRRRDPPGGVKLPTRPAPRGRRTSPAGSRSLPLPGPRIPPPAPPRRPPPPAPLPRPSFSPPPPRPGASGRPGCANPGRGPPPDAELGPARPRPLTSGFA